MSLFADGSYKQEVYDSLHWIINNFNPEVLDPKIHLEFIHQNIVYIITNQYEKVNPHIKEWGLTRGYSYEKILKELGELYQGITEYDFKI
ncbi:hypothetical protein AB9M62_25285 [Bacillales bacterium AN1005]